MSQAHALSVDVEDWFQVLNMAHVVDRAAWDGYELRCGDATKRLLDLFARRSAKATFFFLGWIAERLPDLVREVAAAGAGRRNSASCSSRSGNAGWISTGFWVSAA